MNILGGFYLRRLARLIKEIYLIKVYDNQIEKALKALKRQLAKEGLLKELKRRSFYEKPSVKRKRKQKEARKKRLKALRYLSAPR